MENLAATGTDGLQDGIVGSPRGTDGSQPGINGAKTRSKPQTQLRHQPTDSFRYYLTPLDLRLWANIGAVAASIDSHQGPSRRPPRQKKRPLRSHSCRKPDLPRA